MRLLLTIVLLGIFTHANASEFKPNYAISTPRDTVKVETVNQFIESIASDRLVLVEPGNYNLLDSKLINAVIKEGNKEVVEINEQLLYSKSNGITLKGVKNLKIVGVGNNPNDVVFSSSNADQYVLTFYGCSNIDLVNIQAQHDASEQGYKMGLWFFNQSSRIVVSKNRLINGKVGTRVSRCKEVTIKNSEVSSCTSGFIELIDSWTLRIGNCSFKDNTACNSFWYMSGCMDVLAENNTIENNSYKVDRNCRESKLFSIARSEMVFFKNNIIRNNETKYLGNTEAVRLIKSSNDLKRNKFKQESPADK